MRVEEDADEAATAAFMDAPIRRRPSKSGSKSNALELSNSTESSFSDGSFNSSNSRDDEGEEVEEEEEEEEEEEMEYQALDYP